MALNDLPRAPDTRANIIERELTEFSHIVSHDLAAPCRHLSHFSRLLLLGLDSNLTDSQRKYVDQIQAAGEKFQSMLEQLLLFTRVQTCQFSYASQDAAHLAKTAVLQLSREVRDAGAEVSIESMGTVFGDCGLLTMAFKELIANAIKFRERGRPCHVRVFGEAREDHWVGRIVDDGVGLETAYHEKAFRMFWQLNADDSEGGVGAGLAIVRRIARRHGGEARFVPTTAGACVEVELPFVRSET
jgi:light-regulated signal transduction histidine kinase (bacteriophytochrome)